jgi:maltose-binding protein MalE
MKRFLSVFLTLMLLMSLSGISALAQEDVKIEFIQWWEPELPGGFFRGLMDEFEAQNPGIKVDLISGPYSSTKDQIIAGAATGTLCDVVGLDGAWVNDLSKQGAIANLDDLVATYKADDSEFGAKVAVGGKNYMYGVVTFAYTMFVNNDLLNVTMVENLHMADHVADLCKISLIDVLFIGPGDLSQACGVPGQTGHPKVLEVAKRICDGALAGGKKVGVYAATLEDVERYMSWGVQYIAHSAELNMIASKFTQVVSDLHRLRTAFLTK